MYSLLGAVGDAAETIGAIPPGWSLPLPLPWTGASDYGNTVNAPQSEAGLWSAIALERLIGKASDLDGKINRALAAVTNSSDDNSTMLTWDSPCLASQASVAVRMPSCTGSIASMALERIQQVQQHYQSLGIWYESNLTLAVAFEVRSAMALSSGRLQAAMDQAALAAEADNAAVIMPVSTTLYFTPGTAFLGALALRVATVATKLTYARGSSSAIIDKGILSKPVPGLKNHTTVADLLHSALEAFEKCLDRWPDLPLCQLGAARTNDLLRAKAKARSHYKAKARSHYKALLSTWGAFKGKPARKSCKDAWREADAWAL
jgi:hypothetical protein